MNHYCRAIQPDFLGASAPIHAPRDSRDWRALMCSVVLPPKCMFYSNRVTEAARMASYLLPSSPHASRQRVLLISPDNY
ncbi:hypothetical protein TGAM01_v202557 [Trichoderma gamsii]|uniref:Uncharacterized protein n=1 Tax=Trichoderma gamsii TaxID=398673 RepID=A0A2P4ZWP6_9HYPO|nr:hypothetical protein TGAM01_v202557 [Trichoderma gamsii]PON28710.1 hypothetical protein TGAM01_v202557 [Trichoderma gamsii]